MVPDLTTEKSALALWVATWQAAGPELERIARRESEGADRQSVVRQLFEGMEAIFNLQASGTSGLVEQQMWFSRIRAASEKTKPDARE